MELILDEISVIIDKCLVLEFIIDTQILKCCTCLDRFTLAYANLTEKCDREWSRNTFTLLLKMSIIYNNEHTLSHTNTYMIDCMTQTPLD